ncbi:MAG: capsule biosynthesis protein [Sphingomicrobium sp.]
MRSVERVTVLVKNDGYRRLAYALLALLFALLIFFPRPFVSRAKIVPQDTSASAASTTALIGALGGSTQSIGSLLTGGRPSNDLYLIIGRSDSVKSEVIRTLKLVGPNRPFATNRKAILWLDRHVDVHLLLGGVMEIETKLYDPDTANRVTTAYGDAIGRHLARYGRQIINNKQRIVQQRFGDAAERVREAESQVQAFRRAHNLAEPEQQLSTALSQRANLEAQMQARQVQLQALSRVRGPENSEVIGLQTEIAALRNQISQTVDPSTGPTGPNVGGLTAVSLRYLDLFRNLRFQQSLYEIYQRSAEQVAIEELASESASYFQVVDPPHIDPERQYNTWAIGAFAGIVLLALFTEWYAPSTGLMRWRRVRRTKLAEQV